VTAKLIALQYDISSHKHITFLL